MNVFWSVGKDVFRRIWDVLDGMGDDFVDVCATCVRIKANVRKGAKAQIFAAIEYMKIESKKFREQLPKPKR